MIKASPCLVGLAALALALAVVAAPPVPGPDPAQPEKPLPRDQKSLYAHSAISAVVDANGGKVPATGLELTAALAKLGDFVQLPVTFSAVALNSGLAHPRVVIAMRPSSHPAPVSQFSPNGRTVPGGWGGRVASGTTKLVPGAPAPLGRATPNAPYLEGRLFLAANTERTPTGKLAVKTVEFISWNSRALKFDFGAIEGMGSGTPELKVLDGTRCFSCHKNRGPILGAAPWSNTAHNDLVRATSKDVLNFPHAFNQNGVEDDTLPVRDDIDGLALLKPNAPEVDAAVRRAADALRHRETVRLFARSAEGRKALMVLLGAVVGRRGLDDDKAVRFELNLLDLADFMRDAFALQKATAPSTLSDFSPAGAVNKAVVKRTTGGWGGVVTTNQVNRYDTARAQGDHGLPSLHQPSNPKAFERSAVKAPQHPSEILSAAMVARAIGLSTNDRDFLTHQLDQVARSLDRTAPALAKEIFAGPQFADVFETGTLPDRDDFKDRFVAGLRDLRSPLQNANEFKLAREEYARAPRRDPNAAAEKEITVLPSHACASCHDFRTGAKPTAFSPIPLLAFDPFDLTAREAWLKTATRKQKQDTLGRLFRRLDKDKDMPPDDSLEAEMYRVKDPTAINTVKEWLEVELKKLK